MSVEQDQPISRINWQEARAALKDKLSTDDQLLVDLLVAGKSTPAIAKELGTNRSAVWRRVQKIKQQL